MSDDIQWIRRRGDNRPPIDNLYIGSDIQEESDEEEN